MRRIKRVEKSIRFLLPYKIKSLSSRYTPTRSTYTRQEYTKHKPTPTPYLRIFPTP